MTLHYWRRVNCSDIFLSKTDNVSSSVVHVKKSRHDRSFFTCHDEVTGEEIYGKQRIARDTANFTASPWAYNGHVFCLNEDGDTFVIEAGPEFKVLGRNSLGEMAMATPAIANGSLIVRTYSQLWRISQPG